MIKKILLPLILAFAPFASAQTPVVLTAPQVLGCSNPAPAVAPSGTVWFSSCKTAVFVPLNTTSLVASVSKTSPVWAHTYGGYLSVASTALLVACPINATVSSDGSTCKDSTGADASALVTATSVATFSITPPAPPPVLVDITLTFQGSPAVTWSQVPAGSCFSVSDGTHTSQLCAPTN
jgi:hypothetical protein